MDKLSMKIAGEIALSSNPGGTMKKWREIFEISQADLAEYLKISPSTVSDYEGNRRKSPGIGIVRRFVDALLDMDTERGRGIANKFKETETEEFFEVHEFATAITAREFAERIGGKVIVPANLERDLYGYSVVDSVKVILELPHTSLSRIYGTTSERAVIFTNVSSGRSPMVAIRVAGIKPSLVVMHGLKKVDRLAMKIAQAENLPMIITETPIAQINEKLKRFEI